MFKSSFSKYLTAFVIIILVSFLLLSGIISSMIRSNLTEDKVGKLKLATTSLADFFEDRKVERLADYIGAEVASPIFTLIPLINMDYDLDVLITDGSGEILLSTLVQTSDGSPAIRGELGTLPENFLSSERDEDGLIVYKGRIEGLTDDVCLVYGDEIITKDVCRGYVFTLASTASEDRLIGVTRRAVINSSIWVMLAAVIATYFITERIVHPLKHMTKAAKRYAKGDFSERIPVTGNDEISDLAVAFNNMADSLDNLEKMRNSFLASVSHDLRTPMTTILGFIEGINSGAIPPEKHQHYLGVISQEVHRLSRLVGQLLDISRIESGDKKFTFGDFDIAEVARLIIISFEKKLEEKSLDVSFDSDEDTMLAFGDKDAIYQVLYNLVHNGIKFSNEGGKFKISLTRIGSKRIRVSVFDEGQTISDEDAEHVFDRFYKTDKSRGLDKNGVGLGLYICKTIVDAHGEEICLERSGDGCEFYFTVKEAGSVKTREKG